MSRKPRSNAAVGATRTLLLQAPGPLRRRTAMVSASLSDCLAISSGIGEDIRASVGWNNDADAFVAAQLTRRLDR